MENCYFNYENWNAKQTFTKTEVKKGIKTDTQYAEKKFELGHFECSISSIRHSLEM